VTPSDHSNRSRQLARDAGHDGEERFGEPLDSVRSRRRPFDRVRGVQGIHLVRRSCWTRANANLTSAEGRDLLAHKLVHEARSGGSDVRLGPDHMPPERD
jgi:hypothetical protein